jgi:hypothetical protein
MCREKFTWLGPAYFTKRRTRVSLTVSSHSISLSLSPHTLSILILSLSIKQAPYLSLRLRLACPNWIDRKSIYLSHSLSLSLSLSHSLYLSLSHTHTLSLSSQHSIHSHSIKQAPTSPWDWDWLFVSCVNWIDKKSRFIVTNNSFLKLSLSFSFLCLTSLPLLLDQNLIEKMSLVSCLLLLILILIQFFFIICWELSIRIGGKTLEIVELKLLKFNISLISSFGFFSLLPWSW